MANSKIKKVIIPKSKLPAYSGENQSYIIRYRVVSEDKNRTSHWSPQYRLPVVSQTTVQHAITVDPVTKFMAIAWEPLTNYTGNYDVYIKWDNGAYSYIGPVSTTTYTSVVKTGASTVQIAVQVPTFPTKRFTNATIFETPVTSVVV